MLPDFPEAKAPLVRAVNTTLRRLVNQRPLLSMFRHYHFHEGRGWVAYGEDTTGEDRRFKAFAIPSEVPTAELIEEGPLAFFKRLPELAASMGAEIERHMMERISEAARTPGAPAVGFEGAAETFEEHLERLEKLPIQFDDDGTPHLPGMINVTPEYAAKMEAWERDPACQEAFKAFLARKREEFNAHESRRGLAD